MRTIGGPALAILNGAAFWVYSKMEIKNASGTWKDFTNLAGKDYFIGARLSTDVDTPVWSLQATLKRDGEFATESLSPLRGDSTLNVDDLLAPAPAINAAREWRLSTATVAVGATPSGLDWVEVCAGYLDKPDFTADPMQIEGRSVGARLLDSTIRVKRTYTGSLASVAQQIVTDNLPSPAPPLYIPVAPTFTVTEYTPYQVTVMDALVTLALSTGWMVRDVYDPGDGLMKTAILDPGRSQATADTTIAPSTYIAVDQASLDVANVRNVIEGEAIDGVTGEIISITVTDPASITAFGGVERYMKFSEDATSPINTGNELLDMANAALADLSTPKFDHVVTSTLFWPSEIADLYDFTGNAVHYDTTQRLAVFGIVHDLTTPAHGTTQWTCRGAPAGAYLEWIRRQGPGPTGPLVPPAPVIEAVLGEADSYGADEDDDASGYDGGVWVLGRFNAGCTGITVYAELADGEGFSVDQTSSTVAIPDYRRPDGVEGFDPNYQFLFRLRTPARFYKRITLVGRSASGLLSRENIWPSAIQAIDPIPTPEDGTIADIAVTRNAIGTEYTVTVTPGSVDTVLTENWLVITRNGLTVFKVPIGTSLSPVTFLDTGLTPQNTYQYEAFIANIGATWCVTGPKNRFVSQNPPLGTAPQFTVGPVAKIINDVPQVYMEGVTGLVGANRMAMVKSLDQVNTETIGISSALTPFIGIDPNTGPKWYRLIAYSSTDPNIFAASDWRWWPGLQPTGSQGAVPPVFTGGTPRRELAGGGGGTVAVPVLAIRWTCATSGAAQISIQQSDDNGLTDPWTEIARDASFASGEYRNVGLAGTPAWYRLVALDVAGAALAASAGVEYL